MSKITVLKSHEVIIFISDAQINITTLSYGCVIRSGSGSSLVPKLQKTKLGLIEPGNLPATSISSKTRTLNKKQAELWHLLHLYPHPVVSILLKRKK